MLLHLLQICYILMLVSEVRYLTVITLISKTGFDNDSLKVMIKAFLIGPHCHFDVKIIHN